MFTGTSRIMDGLGRQGKTCGLSERTISSFTDASGSSDVPVLRVCRRWAGEVKVRPRNPVLLFCLSGVSPLSLPRTLRLILPVHSGSPPVAVSRL